MCKNMNEGKEKQKRQISILFFSSMTYFPVSPLILQAQVSRFNIYCSKFYQLIKIKGENKKLPQHCCN